MCRNSSSTRWKCEALFARNSRLGASMLPRTRCRPGAPRSNFCADESQNGLDEAGEAGPLCTGSRRTRPPTGAAGPRTRRDLQHGIRGYFLIVADFIVGERMASRWSGRGSARVQLDGVRVGDNGSGSDRARPAVRSAFLNPERVSMPDFDVDFCMEGRDRVIEYVAKKYGRERVFADHHVCTLAAKAVDARCGRVLGHNTDTWTRLRSSFLSKSHSRSTRRLAQEEDSALVRRRRRMFAS